MTLFCLFSSLLMTLILSSYRDIRLSSGCSNESHLSRHSLRAMDVTLPHKLILPSLSAAGRLPAMMICNVSNADHKLLFFAAV